jgi:hypothetical protein
MKIAKNKYSFSTLMSSRVAIVHPYVAYIIDSLLKRGYLKGSREVGYQLTLKSKRAIKKHLEVNGGNSNNIVFFNLRRNHEAIVKGAIQKIKALGTKCDSKLEHIHNPKSNWRFLLQMFYFYSEAAIET